MTREEAKAKAKAYSGNVIRALAALLHAANDLAPEDDPDKYDAWRALVMRAREEYDALLRLRALDASSPAPAAPTPHEDVAPDARLRGPRVRHRRARSEVLEVTDCGGEPVAYYVQGHNADVSDGELARTAASRICDPALEDSIIGEIRREWWCSVPCDCGDHDEHFRRAEAAAPRALAVTAWHVDGDGWLGAEEGA